MQTLLFYELLVPTKTEHKITVESIIKWGEERKITTNSTPLAQYVKTTEEFQELFQAGYNMERQGNAKINSTQPHTDLIYKIPVVNNDEPDIMNKAQMNYLFPVEDIQEDKIFNLNSDITYNDVSNSILYTSEVKDAIGDILVTLLFVELTAKEKCNVIERELWYTIIRREFSNLLFFLLKDVKTIDLKFDNEGNITYLGEDHRIYGFIYDALSDVYDVIKHRKGEMNEQGIFVKEEDLKIVNKDK